MASYYQTDEELEAAEALSFAARTAASLGKDPRMWRWVIIALHNAVQGFMVLSLRHGNGLLALTQKSAGEWLAAYGANTGVYPEEQLDKYLSLYKKVKSQTYGAIGGNKPFKPIGTEGKSIRQLNSLRNQFIHFTPKGWSLEISGLPRIGKDCLRLVAFLGWETPNILWHRSIALRRAKAAHKRMLSTLLRLERAYDLMGSGSIKVRAR